VPLQVGDWEARSEEMDPALAAATEMSGYLMRTYVHRHDKTELSLLIVAGRSGPMAVHTPDVCYTSSGHTLVSPQTRVSVAPADGGPESEFWSARFRKGEAGYYSHLTIHWGWSHGGPTWEAPANARLALARYPALYKLYVVRASESADDSPAADPSVGF